MKAATLPPVTSTDTELPFREVVRTLARQKWLVAIVILFFAALGVLSILLTTPMYRSATRIAVQGQLPNIQDPRNVDPMQQFAASNMGDVASQIELLQGSTILLSALQRANVNIPPPDPSGPQDPRVVVRQVGNTRVLDITVDSHLPDAAEKIALAIPEVYQEFVRNADRSKVQGGLSFLDQQLADERTKLAKAESDLQKLRNSGHYLILESESAERSARLSRAQLALRDAEAEYSGAKQAYDATVAARRGIPMYETQPQDTTNVQAEQQARATINDIQTRLKGLQAQYTDANPMVKEALAQLRQAQANLRSIPPNINSKTRSLNPLVKVYDQRVTEARARYVAAQAQVQERRANLAASQADLDRLGGLQAKQTTLLREANDHANLVGKLVQQREELALRQNSFQNLVQVATPATRAEKVKPSETLNMAIALILGLIASIPIALAKDRKEDRVNSPEEAVRIAEAAPLGFLPNLTGRAALPSSTTDLASPQFERYRVLRSNVMFNLGEEAMRSILVTCTDPGEGTAELAYNFAVSLAVEGRRVLLVDGNVRNPSLHVRTGIAPTPGLTEVVAGTAAIGEAAAPTPIQGLFVLPAGGKIDAPGEFYSSQKLHDTIAGFENAYDMVVVNGPPCLPNADAPLLASCTDTVLYLVTVGSTKRIPLTTAIRRLRQAHANLVGLVYAGRGGTETEAAYSFRKL